MLDDGAIDYPALRKLMPGVAGSEHVPAAPARPIAAGMRLCGRDSLADAASRGLKQQLFGHLVTPTTNRHFHSFSGPCHKVYGCMGTL